MTLATHAIVGASIASIMPSHPVLGFALGFSSHFLLDAIPHWDYTLTSVVVNENDPMDVDMKINRNFIFDLFRIGTDATLGLIVVLIFFGVSNYHLVWTPIWGMVGAILPDVLQFVYFKFRHEPFRSIQKFHCRIQTHLVNNHTLGRVSQIIVIILFVAISKLFF